ncbi:MAG: M15 family metallopeptidase [Microthrixaceae bacterium]
MTSVSRSPWAVRRRSRAHGHAWRRVLVSTTVVVTVLPGVLAAAPASAQGATGAPAATDRSASTPSTSAPVDRRHRRAAQKVDVARADADQVEALMADTAAREQRALSALAAARELQAATDAAVDEAKARERVAADAAAVADRNMRQAAVVAYIGADRRSPLGILTAGDSSDMAWRVTLLDREQNRMAQLLRRQRSAHRELRRRRAALDEAAAARRAGDDADREVRTIGALRANQQAVLVAVNGRLEAAVSEADALAQVDAAAARALRDREENLAATARKYVPVSARRSTSKAPTSAVPGRSTAQPVASVPAPSTASAPVTTPAGSPSVPPTTTSPPVVIPVPQPVDTVVAAGFVVARAIAPQVSAMVSAAAVVGLRLGGSAYRDVNRQIELRRQHCGTDDYSIWLMPSGQCRPPTAVPGRSMHEKGLALDITCNGTLIGTRSDPCFVWLQANAASFGLRNLPSEPWHWSTTGS